MRLQGSFEVFKAGSRLVRPHQGSWNTLSKKIGEAAGIRVSIRDEHPVE